jgi:glycerol kinase
VWDYGARGALCGLSRGSTRSHVVRAVLEGVAHRGADIVEAAEADTGLVIGAVRIDGGMSQNPTFVQACADAFGRPVDVAAVPDSTTVGAAFLAGVGIGFWTAVTDIEALWQPARRVQPSPGADRAATRHRWLEARARSQGWLPDLSALDF